MHSTRKWTQISTQGRVKRQLDRKSATHVCNLTVSGHLIAASMLHTEVECNGAFLTTKLGGWQNAIQLTMLLAKVAV